MTKSSLEIKSSYSEWKNSQIKRKLLSIEKCGKIANSKKIAKNPKHFQYFIQYLLDMKKIEPLTYHNKYSRDFHFNAGFYTYSNTPKEIPYFHPLQFLQIIDNYLSVFRKFDEKLDNEKFQQYLFNQEKKENINKAQTQIKERKEKRENRDPFGPFTNPEKALLEWKKKKYLPWKKTIHPLISNLPLEWLSNKILKLWIKLENIFRNVPLITNLIYFNTSPHIKILPQSKVEDYNNWREKIKFNQYFHKEEIDILINFLFWIKKKGSQYGQGLDREFDLIPYLRTNNFQSSLWVATIFLNIQKYLIEVLYRITNLDYSLQEPRPVKPDFLCEDETDYQNWLTSILIHHSLVVKPIKLIVEGATEDFLIQKYINSFWMSRWSQVINQKGIGNNHFYDKVFGDIEFNYYWYILDYDKGQHIENYKNISNKTWMFPDFITEIFEPDEILGAFIELINDLSTSTSIEIDHKEILQKLEMIKKKSIEMARQFEKKRSIDDSNSLPLNMETEGFEQFIIGYSFNNKNVREILFPKEFWRYTTSYQELGDPTKKKLKQIFLKKFTKYLLNYLIVIKKDSKQRNKKFDLKMKDFLSFADEITNRHHKSLLS
uniref:Uncharacterized protein n=1 Tax=Promethearchaeum syntrophicum TaxID=2594042 RepID=A0A5B9DGD7_9ARCH|nr:hypothetical protein [Candidatus Prometheoarchaeum syntrophicum]QEE17737.1 hypothetical protein DSAG12_03575 [Candidatus Prometheoarchaeum syntrophicum]